MGSSRNSPKKQQQQQQQQQVRHDAPPRGADDESSREEGSRGLQTAGRGGKFDPPRSHPSDPMLMPRRYNSRHCTSRLYNSKNPAPHLYPPDIRTSAAGHVGRREVARNHPHGQPDYTRYDIVKEVKSSQVKSSSGATRPRGDHPDPNLFLPSYFYVGWALARSG